MAQLLEKKLQLLLKTVDLNECEQGDDNPKKTQQENESGSPKKKLFSENEERAIALLVRYGVSLR